jgi:hypothetical protein
MSLLKQLITSPSGGAVKPEDWIDGWDYRKSHEIDGSVIGAQTDYLMGIKVNYGEGTYFENNGVHNPFYDGDNPSSVYYNGKTYIVWQGGAGYDPFIVCYDHSANEWSDIVKVGTNPLSSDSHGAPALLIDDSGYLHVFYGCKHTNLEYAKSDNPEDITSWTAQGDPVGSCTYPCPVMLANGDIDILYRHTTGAFGDQRYIKSDDDGASWDAAVQIIEIDVAATHSIYAYTPRVHGNNIHMIWRYHDGTNSENVYHAYLNTTDGHMYSMDGTDLGTSITKAEADANCRVVDTGAYITGHMALHLDGDGYPYIIYLKTTDTGRSYYFVRWSGAAWEAVEEITTTDHNGNGMDFIVHSATSITAFLIGDGGAGQGGDIDEWDWDGTWSLTKTILSEADSGKPLVRPEVVKDYDSELMLIFSQYGGVDVTGLELYAYNGTNLVPKEEEAVYCGERCKTDFGDIRFTESDKETELEYWMEKKVDSDYAIFWVKIPIIPADPDSATIYMYYGKADAVSSSTEMREDFTGYTEVEEIDDIQKTAYHVDFIDRRNRTTYLYKDYGEDYFGDFAYHLDIKRVTHGVSALIAHILLANVIKGEKAMRDVNDAHLWPFGVGGDTPLMNSWESDAGGVNRKALPDLILLATGTMYYVSFRKYGTSLIVDTYTTQAKRAIGGDGDFAHQTMTLQADYKFQYNYVGNTYDDNTARTGSSDMESLLLRKYVVPEPTHGSWGAEEPH